MRGRFVARVCGGDKNPEETLSIKKNWSALQSAPFKSAKITGFLLPFITNILGESEAEYKVTALYFEGKFLYFNLDQYIQLPKKIYDSVIRKEYYEARI